MVLKFVNSLKTRSSILILLLVFNATFLKSQQIINQTVSTGYIGADPNNITPLTTFDCRELNDSTLLLMYSTSDSSNLISDQIFNIYRKSDLSLVKRINVWNRGNKLVPRNLSSSRRNEYGIKTFITEDYKSGYQYGYSFNYPLNIDDVEIKINKVNQNLQFTNLIFLDTLRGETPIADPYIYDSTIYLVTGDVRGLSGNVNGFIFYIYAFDFKGNILIKRTIDYNNFKKDDFAIANLGDIESFTTNDSLLIFPLISGKEIVLINRFTLKTHRIGGIDNPNFIQLINNYRSNNHRILTIEAFEYSVESKGVRMGGICNMTDLQFNRSNDQLFAAYVEWDSTLSYFRTFGDTLYNEQAYLYDHHFNHDYLVGSFPINNNYTYGKEYRKVLIHKSDSNQVDSLHLFGNKNHLPGLLHFDNLNNLFVISLYSNAWTNDSIYLQITKVPHAVLTSLEKLTKRENRKVLVYPNPTNQFLYSEEFSSGMRYRIVDLQGKIMFESSFYKEGELDVGELKSGTYLLQLFGEATYATTIFIKN
jgi:hypothetical protein